MRLASEPEKIMNKTLHSYTFYNINLYLTSNLTGSWRIRVFVELEKRGEGGGVSHHLSPRRWHLSEKKKTKKITVLSRFLCD